MKSVVTRDLPSLFLVCMAIMASRFSTDGRNETRFHLTIRNRKPPYFTFDAEDREQEPRKWRKKWRNDKVTHTHAHGLCLHMKAIYHHWSAALSPQCCTWMTHQSFTVRMGCTDMLLGDGRALSSYLLTSRGTLYACFCLVVHCQRSICLLSCSKPSPKVHLNITSIAFIHLQPSLFSLN